MISELRIPTSNEKYIYGTLSTVEQSKWLIIFVHGLTSSQEEPMIAHGQPHFNAKWYSTFRFNLYGNNIDERKLVDTTIKDHITDTNIVVDHFVEQGYTNIILIGHSLGGLTILYSDLTHVSRVVLRDASIGGKELLDDVTYNQEKDYYFVDWWDGVEYLIWNTMYQEFCTPRETNLAQITQVHIPIKIISADSGWEAHGRKYYEAANEPKAFHLVKWAHHCFQEPWAEDELYAESLEWIEEE